MYRNKKNKKLNSLSKWCFNTTKIIRWIGITTIFSNTIINILNLKDLWAILVSIILFWIWYYLVKAFNKYKYYLGLQIRILFFSLVLLLTSLSLGHEKIWRIIELFFEKKRKNICLSSSVANSSVHWQWVKLVRGQMSLVWS